MHVTPRAPGTIAKIPSLEQDRLVDEHEAASVLGLKRQTMAVWRSRGRGPMFVRIGRLVKYRMSELSRYVDSNTFANTAEADAAQE